MSKSECNKYYEANRERIIEKNRKYREEHREEINAKRREKWRNAHKPDA